MNIVKSEDIVKSERQQMDVIHYDEDRKGECLTECPYRLTIADLLPLDQLSEDDDLKDIKIHVGSYACSECMYYRGMNISEKIVHCRRKEEIGHENK